MGDFKSKLPDFKELSSFAGKLFRDVKTSVSEIIDEYKKKREAEEQAAAAAAAQPKEAAPPKPKVETPPQAQAPEQPQAQPETIPAEEPLAKAKKPKPAADETVKKDENSDSGQA